MHGWRAELRASTNAARSSTKPPSLTSRWSSTKNSPFVTRAQSRIPHQR